MVGDMMAASREIVASAVGSGLAIVTNGINRPSFPPTRFLPALSYFGNSCGEKR
jgi:hypothetical protein